MLTQLITIVGNKYISETLAYKMILISNVNTYFVIYFIHSFINVFIQKRKLQIQMNGLLKLHRRINYADVRSNNCSAIHCLCEKFIDYFFLLWLSRCYHKNVTIVTCYENFIHLLHCTHPFTLYNGHQLYQLIKKIIIIYI